MQLCERRTTNGLLQVSWFLCWLESTLFTDFFNGKQGPIQQPNATHVRSQSSIGLQSLIVRLTKSTLGSSLDLDDVVCVGSFLSSNSFLVLGLLNRGMITTSANSMYRAQWNANTHILPGDTRYQGEAGKKERNFTLHFVPPKGTCSYHHEASEARQGKVWATHGKSVEQVRSQLLEALSSGDDLGRCPEPCHDVAMGRALDLAA